MALDVSALNVYTDEQKLPLIKKSVLGGKTLNYITVQPDIKSSASINIIDSTLEAAAGSCGWNANGTTNLTQRDLSVDPIKINESICLDTLEKYYTQSMMNPGSYNEDIPFEQMYAEEKAEKISAMVEDMYWKANKASGSGNLALTNGIIQVLEETTASGSTVAGNTGSVTAITPANVVDVIDDIILVTPADILDADNLVLFVGHEVYRTAAKALRDANLYHYTGAENDFEMEWPGTNVRLVATRGLRNTNRMFLSQATNFYMGTDLVNDAEDFRIFYSEDNDEVRFRSKFKIGANVAFPDFVVAFKLA